MMYSNMSLINKKTLAEEVADRLIEQIFLGNYKIGDKLPIESELMKIFGVGRSSIREAIKILSIQGLLAVQQGVGTFVASDKIQESLNDQMGRAEIADVIEVRSLLEVKIAEKAALNRTATQLKTSKQWLSLRKKFAAENDVQNCIHADVNFHISIAEACGNPILTEIYKTASIQVTKSFVSSNLNTDSFKESHSLHEYLLQWIELQIPEKAASAANSIISRL